MKRFFITEMTPEYVTIQEAASILEVSDRTVYGYIEDGGLAAFSFGKSTVLKKDDVLNYQRKSPGRIRINTPGWRKPPETNTAYITSITIQIIPGQHERLEQKLDEMRQGHKHTFTGTAQRYIARSQNEVQMMLVWRSAVMPTSEERAAALAAFREDLANVLDWETACVKESQVLLLT